MPQMRSNSALRFIVNYYTSVKLLLVFWY